MNIVHIKKIKTNIFFYFFLIIEIFLIFKISDPSKKNGEKMTHFFQDTVGKSHKFQNQKKINFFFSKLKNLRIFEKIRSLYFRQKNKILFFRGANEVKFFFKNFFFTFFDFLLY